MTDNQGGPFPAEDNRYWDEYDEGRDADLWKVLGDRRSIRFFKPYRPVERWKVEMMFEASHRSSRAIVGSFIKSVAVERDSLTVEQRDALKTPTTTTDLDLAPMYIFTYCNPRAAEGGPARLRDYYDRGAFSPAIGWSERYADRVLWPNVLKPQLENPARSEHVSAVEAGQSIAHMLLAATALGLGTCCKAFNPDAAKEILGVPDTLKPLWLILVGYPAEDAQAGGQRPRPALGDDYFWGSFDTPFETDEATTKELWRRKLHQPKAPTSWRQDELKAIARAYGLPE